MGTDQLSQDLMIQNILSIVLVSACFFAMFILPVYIIMGFKFKASKLIYNSFASLSIGSFVMINVAYVLSALDIFSFFPLLIAIILCIAASLALFYRKRTVNQFKSATQAVYLTIKGVNKPRVVIRGLFKKFSKNIGRFILDLLKHPFEICTFGLGLAGAIYIRCYYTVTMMGFGASDLAVHADWIKRMIGNEYEPAYLFSNGVYPMGMHAMIGEISTFFRINAVTVIRCFGPIIGILIVLSLYMLLKELFKSKAAVGIGFMIYTLTDFIVRSAYGRQSYALPQEAALIFLLPSAVFFNRYLKEKKTQDLIFFVASFGLTIACHFYVTIAGAFLIAAIAIVNFRHLIKEKILFKTLIAGIISVALVLAPMLIAVATPEREWEQSMGWATRVISGTNTYQLEQKELEEAQAAEKAKEGKVDNSLEGRIQRIIDDVTDNFIQPFYYISLILISGVMVLYGFAFLFSKKKGRAQYGRFIASMGLYSLFMLVLASSAALGLPELIDKGRSSIFVSLNYAVVYGFVLEFVFIPLALFRKKTIVHIVEVLACFTLAGYLLYTYMPEHFQKIGDYSQVQYNGAVVTYYKIEKNFEKWDWCIVSPVDELSMIRNDGWHYEISDLVYELGEHETGKDIRLPSSNIFLYVEKNPIMPYRVLTAENTIDKIETLPSVSKENASQNILDIRDEIGLASGIYTNYENRQIVLSKFYYWVQEYKKYFPEISVYYEDENIVVYWLRQTDVYAINNLSIDYGYNDYDIDNSKKDKEKTKTDTE